MRGLERFEHVAIACSFQKESAVVIDLVRQVKPDVRVFTLDTGVLFPQTYAIWKTFEEHFGIQIEAFKGEWIDGLWATDPDRCCALRKVEPLNRALEGADCWVSGLRRDQSPDRAETPELHFDERHGLWKANPLAAWTDKDVWTYLHEHGLPYNPLHDEGYASIGCTHCTLPGEGREGRWAGSEKSECGLHVDAVSPASA